MLDLHIHIGTEVNSYVVLIVKEEERWSIFLTVMLLYFLRAENLYLMRILLSYCKNFQKKKIFSFARIKLVIISLLVYIYIFYI